MSYRTSLLGQPIFVLCFGLQAFLGSMAVATAETELQQLDFTQEVAPILDKRCACCHVGERAKAGFKIDDREMVLGYVEPGDPENSVLWSDYLNGPSALHDPASSVMPMCGPMPDAELNTIKRWIVQGATWPEGAKFVSIGGIEDAVDAQSQSKGVLARLCGFIGYFHPAVVHFPIALLMFGGASAGLSFLTGGRAVYVAFYCLVWGTLFSIVASVMGWCFAAEKGYPNWSAVPTAQSLEAASAVFRHRWLGVFTTVVSVLSLAVALLAMRFPRSKLKHLWRFGLMVAALLVSIVGHQGGELVYGDILHRAFDRLLGK
jgi:uncharacterized membrane protein